MKNCLSGMGRLKKELASVAARSEEIKGITVRLEVTLVQTCKNQSVYY